ncbi:MAG: hypothetical protein D6781_13600 [Verrucomicrobia bacterium]|nr:MAG: hypothetical protein D6781_13600 [Verrucomicrobiota bacterium]
MARPIASFACALIPLLVLTGVLSPRLEAVSLGDDRAAVVAELGEPAGEVATEGVTVLVYPRGEIRLREGRVSAINLVSPAEHAARLARAETERRERLTRLEEEGRRLKASRASDPEFLRLPPHAQLQFWRSFASRYPMVSIDAELQALRERIETEKQLRELEAASDDRLARLETRVEEAEARARQLELQANALRHFNRRSSSRYHYGSAIIIGAGGYCPPVRPIRPLPHPPRPVPYADSITEARARAMADIEASRRAIYSEIETP